MEKEIDKDNSDSTILHKEDTNLVESTPVGEELLTNGIVASPSEDDPRRYCELCNWESEKYSTFRSMSKHVRDEHPEAYDDWKEMKDSYQKSVKKPTTRRLSTSKSTVTVKGIETEYDPAEEHEISRLRRETEILKERLRQKDIADKLGVPEREEAQHRAQMEDEQRREDLQGQMFRMQRDEIKQLREDNKANLKFQLELLKSNNETQLKVVESQHKMEISVERMKTENAHQLSEMERASNDYRQWTMKTGDRLLNMKMRQFEDETGGKVAPTINPSDEDDIYKQLEMKDGGGI